MRRRYRDLLAIYNHRAGAICNGEGEGGRRHGLLLLLLLLLLLRLLLRRLLLLRLLRLLLVRG